uniref:Uncharacterized protein n=1 Tax=Knipowitschia caucasica TaxID=637954 RepID=A0AAV2MA49_KNICA
MSFISQSSAFASAERGVEQGVPVCLAGFCGGGRPGCLRRPETMERSTGNNGALLMWEGCAAEWEGSSLFGTHSRIERQKGRVLRDGPEVEAQTSVDTAGRLGHGWPITLHCTIIDGLN